MSWSRSTKPCIGNDALDDNGGKPQNAPCTITYLCLSVTKEFRPLAWRKTCVSAPEGWVAEHSCHCVKTRERAPVSKSSASRTPGRPDWCHQPLADGVTASCPRLPKPNFHWLSPRHSGCATIHRRVHSGIAGRAR